MKSSAEPQASGNDNAGGHRRRRSSDRSDLMARQSSPRLIPPSQPSQWYIGPSSSHSPSLSLSSAAAASNRQQEYRPSSVPSYGSSSGLGRMRRKRRELESDDGSAGERRGRSSSIGSPLVASGGSSPRLIGDASRPLLVRTGSNPFLRKPLHVSSESSPLLGGHQQFGSVASMRSNASIQDSNALNQVKELQAPPVTTHGNVERHLTLLDLIAVGVGGTLGTGFFLLCSLLASSYAGPSSIFCWVLSAAPALLSGFCFAELAGQIPAAGSTYVSASLSSQV